MRNEHYSNSTTRSFKMNDISGMFLCSCLIIYCCHLDQTRDMKPVFQVVWVSLFPDCLPPAGLISLHGKTDLQLAHCSGFNFTSNSQENQRHLAKERGKCLLFILACLLTSDCSVLWVFVLLYLASSFKLPYHWLPSYLLIWFKSKQNKNKKIILKKYKNMNAFLSIF